MVKGPPDRYTWYRRGANILWEPLSDAQAVFDPDTGETHFLTELPALMLMAVGPNPAHAAELLQKITGPIELDETSTEAVYAALRQLEFAGLVESATHQSD